MRFNLSGEAINRTAETVTDKDTILFGAIFCLVNRRDLVHVKDPSLSTP